MNKMTGLIVLIVLYFVVDFFVVQAFLTQRAVLDMQRALMLPIDFRPIVCPLSKWYNYRRIPQVIDWAILILIAYEYEWYYAVILFVLDFAVTSFIPIPKSKLEWAKNKMDDAATGIAKGNMQ
jgi:hypothetical protein